MNDLGYWLRQLGHPRLLVLGDLMLDRYLWGEAERVSPEAPVLVLREDFDEVRPGGAANVASFLRGLEAEVILAGVVGDDAEGRTVRRLMDDLSVDSSAVVTDSARPTTTKQRLVGRAAQRQPHQILRVDRESRTPLSSGAQQWLLDKSHAAMATCDAVLISDYAKGVCTPDLLQSIIAGAREQAIPVLIDPSRGGDYARYAHATVLTPNRVAAEQLLGKPLRDLEAIQNELSVLRERLDLDAAVLTLDRDGLAYATPNAVGVVPCRQRQVCDVTGAGDMVLALLGLCYAANVPLLNSLRMANMAAGLEVERFGVEPITRQEIERELAATSIDSHRAALTLEELLPVVAAHRRAGRTIVFTNGCFDLLHVGHVAMLQEAAEFGDVLVVAINSDASVRNLKGPERPIIVESDRARMLAALACVDHVLIFDDNTPHRLLHAIRPDVLVKGGTTGEIVGREIVEAYRGTIARTTVVSGYSTTQLMNRMRADSPHSEAFP